MGIGFVASPHNYYEGRMKLAGDKTIDAGTFVVVDFAAGTAAPAAATDVTTVYFVAQENDDPVEYAIDDVDQTVKVGELLKLSKLHRDIVVKTTEVTGSPVAGETVTIEADGTCAKGGSGTISLTVRAVEALGADNNLYELEYLA